MEQRVLFQPEVIYCTVLLQWAGKCFPVSVLVTGELQQSVGEGAPLTVQLQVERMGGVIHDGQQPVQCPPLHHKGVQLDADD